MSLRPLPSQQWIETDDDIGRYHAHKLDQRERSLDQVYQCLPGSEAAQRELHQLLQAHLLQYPSLYRRDGDQMQYVPGDFTTAIDGAEPLWLSSLWIADDLAIMEERNGHYHLTGASLCCPSHWSLADKLGRPIRDIHDPIPGFHRALSPKIDRFFEHLSPQHPVVRFNWSLQDHDGLADPPGMRLAIGEQTRLYYRVERQTLVRLPQTGAIAFTIRVYVHPLEQLKEIDSALPSLFASIDTTSPALASYKGFDRLAPALEHYRQLV